MICLSGYNLGMNDRMRKMALAAVLVVPIAVGAGIYIAGGDEPETGGKLPKVTESQPSDSVQTTRDTTVKTKDFTLQPRDGYKYKRRTEGDYTQVLVTDVGDKDPVAVIVSEPTAFTGAGELAASFTGGARPDYTNRPQLKSIQVAGKPGYLIAVRDEGAMTVDVYAFTILKNKVSLSVHARGPLADQDELEAVVQSHSGAIKATR